MNKKKEKDIRIFAKQLLSFAKNCSAISNHTFLELLALKANKKKVVRLVVTTEMYGLIGEFCKLNNLIYGHSDRKQSIRTKTAQGDTFTVSVDWEDPSGEFFVAIIGITKESVQKALEYENNDVSFEKFGKLYQYPPCCIKTYEDIENGSDWIYNYLVNCPLDKIGYYQCNRLAVLFDESTVLPEFFPCNFICRETQKLGKQYEELLQTTGLIKQLQKIQISLKSPLLIINGVLLQLINSKVCENIVKYKPSRDWQIDWLGNLSHNHPFYLSDSLEVSLEQIRLLSMGKVICEIPVDQINNRILLFQ